MTVWESLILGLVQGLTEFLPVSSSGHLVVAGKVLDLTRSGLGFEVWVHLATLAAVTAALWRDLLVMARAILPGADPDVRRRGARLWIGVVVGTIPAVILGLAFKDSIEAAFASVRIVGVDLILTGMFLFATRYLPGRGKPLTAPRAFGIGVAQALAIFPGISRSGATLTAGLLLGLSGEEAARFSFLLAFPAILGAGVLEAGSLVELGEANPLVLVVSFIAAMVSGYVAIRVVWRVMTRGRLYWFAPYCVAVGLLILIFW